MADNTEVPNEFRPGDALPPSVARVKLNRRLGYLASAAITRATRLLMMDELCPPSMSKSTPTMFAEMYVWMNVPKPASEPQVNPPSAPPVEMMYFFPALTKDCRFVATSAGVTPPQFSLPHSPVANARVSGVSPVGTPCVTGVTVPGTDELMTLVFQFRLIVMSL